MPIRETQSYETLSPVVYVSGDTADEATKAAGEYFCKHAEIDGFDLVRDVTVTPLADWHHIDGEWHRSWWAVAFFARLADIPAP